MKKKIKKNRNTLMKKRIKNYLIDEKFILVLVGYISVDVR